MGKLLLTGVDGNQGTGNHITYQEITDEENYQVFDAMGVPRTTDGHFEKGSEAPYRSARARWMYGLMISRSSPASSL